MESVQSIQVSITVDTNKRTYTLDKEADSFRDAEVMVQRFLDGLYLSLFPLLRGRIGRG